MEEDYIKEFLMAREDCYKRGCHRIERKPETEDEIIICYDCDLWFNDSSAKESDLEHRVEPRL